MPRAVRFAEADGRGGAAGAGERGRGAAECAEFQLRGRRAVVGRDGGDGCSPRAGT